MTNRMTLVNDISTFLGNILKIKMRNARWSYWSDDTYVGHFVNAYQLYSKYNLYIRTAQSQKYSYPLVPIRTDPYQPVVIFLFFVIVNFPTWNFKIS